MFDVNSFGWPQWVFIGLTLLGLILALSKHGNPRSPYDFNGAMVANVSSS